MSIDLVTVEMICMWIALIVLGMRVSHLENTVIRETQEILERLKQEIIEIMREDDENAPD